MSGLPNMVSHNTEGGFGRLALSLLVAGLILTDYFQDVLERLLGSMQERRVSAVRRGGGMSSRHLPTKHITIDAVPSRRRVCRSQQGDAPPVRPDHAAINPDCFIGLAAEPLSGVLKT